MSANVGTIQRRKDLFVESDKGKPKDQAERVFQMLKKEYLATGKPIALLYAANKEQVHGFEQRKNKDGRLYIPKGDGQAKFFEHFNKLVNDDKELTPGDITVLPIATKRVGGKTPFANRVDKESLDQDLLGVKTALNDGYTVYGFDNNGQYALGGGKSPDFIKSDDERYNIENVSQGCYTQTELAKLEQQYGQKENYEPLGDAVFDDYLERQYLAEKIYDNKFEETYEDVSLDDSVQQSLDKIQGSMKSFVEYADSHINPFHGTDGIKRATTFYRDTLTKVANNEITDKQGVDQEVSTFLDKSKGKTYEHSFSTMLMKEYNPACQEKNLKQVRDGFNSYKNTFQQNIAKDDEQEYRQDIRPNG